MSDWDMSQAPEVPNMEVPGAEVPDSAAAVAAAAPVPPWPIGDGKETKAVAGTDWKRTVLLCLSLLLICAAIALAVWPFLADRFSAWQASQNFTQAQDAVAEMDSDEVEDQIAAAEAYNEALAAGNVNGTVPYEDQLTLNPDGTMCWVEIPKLGIKTPVYRGGDDETMAAALMAGAAHVMGTSLPVGGETANVAITGHTGMSHTRMFDQLDQLETGDVIVIWTYGRPYAYKVKKSELVKPDQTQVMSLVPGRDLVTLITCRNQENQAAFLGTGNYTHRLIVTCERTDYDPSMSEENNLSYLADPRLAWFAGGVALGGAAIWFVLLALWRRRKAWHLNRVLWENEMCEEEVAELNESDDTSPNRLRTKQFRKAELALFGGELAGKWKRDRDDRSKILLMFGDEGTQEGTVVLETCEGMPDVVLPCGWFEARSLDDELAISVNGGRSLLVFRREKAEKDDCEKQEGQGD